MRRVGLGTVADIRPAGGHRIDDGVEGRGIVDEDNFDAERAGDLAGDVDFRPGEMGFFAPMERRQIEVGDGDAQRAGGADARQIARAAPIVPARRRQS